MRRWMGPVGGHQATVLGNGSILIVGGEDDRSLVLNTAARDVPRRRRDRATESATVDRLSSRTRLFVTAQTPAMVPFLLAPALSP